MEQSEQLAAGLTEVDHPDQAWDRQLAHRGQIGSGIGIEHRVPRDENGGSDVCELCNPTGRRNQLWHSRHVYGADHAYAKQKQEVEVGEQIKFGSG